MKLIIEKTHEVDINPKKIKKLSKRSGVPPCPAEMNVFSNLYSSSSYSNYGHDQPYGNGGCCSNQTGGGESGGTASSGQ